VTRASAVLGISTSGPVETAILDRGVVRMAATPEQALAGLLGCVERVLAETGISLDNVGLVAVCTGPGSFTGLRIGVAFAKSLAHARDIPLIGVSAYDVAEAGHAPTQARIALVPGKKGYYYGRLRVRQDTAFEFVRGDSRAIGAAIRIAAKSGATPVTLYGEIAGGSDAPHAVGGSFAQRPPGDRAREVAKLGLQARDAGARGDWRQVAIDYGQAPYTP
jgi:tRNA threonylcarbamoyl adenosine modification protein YeaZ